MARERYLLNQEVEEVKVTEQSKKSKWNNWWYYHYKLVIVILVIIAVAVVYVHGLVTQVHPDLNIGYVGTLNISEEASEALTDELAKYVEDVNGDGQVVVRLNNYYFPGIDSSETADMSEIVQAQFYSDLNAVTSTIWITDETGFASFGSGNEIDAMFKDIGDANKIPLTEVSVFDNIILSAGYEGWDDEEYTKAIIEELSISVLDLADYDVSEEKEAEMIYAQEVFNKIIE